MDYADGNATVCQQCGHSVPSTARFCGACGVQLSDPERPQGASTIASTPPVPELSHLSSRRRTKVVALAAVLLSVTTYFARDSMIKRARESGPSATIRNIFVAANAGDVDGFRSQLSTWFTEAVQRERGSAAYREIMTSLAPPGSVKSIDILAQRICDGEAAVHFRIQSSTGPGRPDYFRLVSENGLWKINDDRDVGRSCSLPGELLDRTPLWSWTVPSRSESPDRLDPPEADPVTSIRGELTRALAARLIRGYQPLISEFSKPEHIPVRLDAQRALQAGLLSSRVYDVGRTRGNVPVAPGWPLLPHEVGEYALTTEGARFFVIRSSLSVLELLPSQDPLALRRVFRERGDAGAPPISEQLEAVRDIEGRVAVVAMRPIHDIVVTGIASAGETEKSARDVQFEAHFTLGPEPPASECSCYEPEAGFTLGKVKGIGQAQLRLFDDGWRVEGLRFSVFRPD
jgi:hypothetical protein